MINEHTRIRKIYIAYPHECLDSFIDKFLTSKIKNIVLLHNNDSYITDKTMGYERESLIVVLYNFRHEVNYKASIIIDILKIKDIDFIYNTQRHKIIIK